MLEECLRAMDDTNNEIEYWRGEGKKGLEEGRVKEGKLKRLWSALAVFAGRVRVLVDELCILDEKRVLIEEGDDEVKEGGGDGGGKKDVKVLEERRRFRDEVRRCMMLLGGLSKDFDKGLYAGSCRLVAEDVVGAVRESVRIEGVREGEVVFWSEHSEVNQERVIVEDLLYELNVLPLVCALIRNAVRPLGRPWRIKFKYTEATLAIIAGGAYLVTKSSHFGGSGELEKWIMETSASLQRFLEEHVTKPSIAIFDKVFRNTAVKTSASADSLAEERASLQRMIKDFTATNYSDEEALQLAKKGDMLPVLQIYEKELKHPIRNLLAGEILRALLIQVQALKAGVEELMKSANDQLYLNEINLQVLTFLPAALLATGTVYGASALVSKFFSGRSRSYLGSVHEVARIRMHEINIALVQSVSKLDDTTSVVQNHGQEAASEQEEEKQHGSEVATETDTPEQSVVYFESLGVILSKVEALDQLLCSRRRFRRIGLSKWSCQKLRDDLDLLRSSLLSKVQKLRIVDGMYNAYPLLR